MKQEETVLKIKAHIDCLKDNFADKLYEPIIKCIDYHFEDEVWTFEIVIRKVKNITKQIGVNDEGSTAFYGVEINGDDGK